MHLTTRAAVLGFAFLVCSCGTRHEFDLPGIVIWAWQRSEDLRFLDPRTTGVAFLAGTASIARDGAVQFRPRTQALELPPDTGVLPVIRIDSRYEHAQVQPARLFAAMRRIADVPGVRGFQIDFDARLSERAFYRTLLDFAREHISEPVGMTALVSWCDGDRWLDREPVVEAVPMFFRMGRGESRDVHLSSPICTSSVGLCTDEPWPTRRPAGIHRIYLFSPRAWTRRDYIAAMRHVEAWQ